MAEITKDGETQLVVFALDQEEFACDINNVGEVLKMVRITPLPRSIEFVEGVINLRGEVIPVIDLRKRFNMEVVERTAESRIIIVEVDDRMFGLTVDSVSEVARLPNDHIQDAPAQVAAGRSHLIMGVGKMDNRMLIILNIDQLLSTDEQMALDEVKKDGGEISAK